MEKYRQDFNQFMKIKNVKINRKDVEEFREFILNECGWRNTIDYIIIVAGENSVVFSWEFE